MGRGGQHGDLQERVSQAHSSWRAQGAGREVLEWKKDAWRGRKGLESVGQTVRAMPHIRGFGQERGPHLVCAVRPRWGAPEAKRMGGKQAGGDQNSPGA